MLIACLFLCAGFPEQRGAPFAAVRVELLPRGDGGGGGAAPHVASAAVLLALRLGWLRHALYYWPLTSGVVAVGALFSALSAAAAAGLALRRAAPLLRGGGGGDAAARAAPSPRPLPPFRGGSEDYGAPSSSGYDGGGRGSEDASSLDADADEADGASDGDALSPQGRGGGLSDAAGLRQRRLSAATALHPASP